MDYYVISADDHIDMPWLLTGVAPDARRRILCDSARELYGL